MAEEQHDGGVFIGSVNLDRGPSCAEHSNRLTLVPTTTLHGYLADLVPISITSFPRALRRRTLRFRRGEQPERRRSGGCSPRRLPGRADGYPSGPPTDPYVRNARIRFLTQSCCCPRAVPWLSVRRVGERKVSPLCPTSGCSARRRLPSRGSLGPHFPTCAGPLRRDDCHLPVSGGFTCRSPPRYLACFPTFVVSPRGSWSGRSAQITPGLLVNRSPMPVL